MITITHAFNSWILFPPGDSLNLVTWIGLQENTSFNNTVELRNNSYRALPSGKLSTTIYENYINKRFFLNVCSLGFYQKT